MALFNPSSFQKLPLKWVANVGGAVVVAVAIWLAFGPERKIEISSPALIVGHEKSVDLTVSLMTKGWFGALTRTAGTITANGGSRVKSAPPEASTTADSPRATFTVTGAVMGSGKIVLRGSSSSGVHDKAEVEVIVTRGT